jgi:subtilisin family serine protease
MMAKQMKRRSVEPKGDGAPRLGVVIRFNPQAKRVGIRQLEEGGFRVASSKDFRAAAGVPNNLDGADVQYFERFGIAVVRREPERLKLILEKVVQNKALSSVRPERTYRALGSTAATLSEGGRILFPATSSLQRDYLRGYRDGIDELIERLLGGEEAVGANARPRFEETGATWGLQASSVIASSLTGAGIKIAVLDTGFDDTHADFAGRIIVKKSFVSHSSDNDVVGHGTHCIGSACGPLRPTTGPRYGIAYEAEIYAGKVLGDDGIGTDRSIYAGMEWALDQDCQVISMSLGASTRLGDQPSEEYEQIGQICLDAGTIVVAAAGNESSRPDRIAPVGSPANASTIMAVGAIDAALQSAGFSCGGVNPSQEVDIAAPGVGILSCIPGDKYDRWDGTSMATPHVAGIAALIAQSDPKYRGWALWARLLQISSRLKLPARDVGKGLVQAPMS